MISHVGRTPTVLLVDDEQCVVSTLAAALRWAGYQVLCAESPKVALAAALYTETPIDLLITDILMPEMDGPEFARELARYHPEARTLYIATQPYTDTVRREVEGRGYPLLAKPFTVRVFLQTVRGVLSSRACSGRAGTSREMSASG